MPIKKTKKRYPGCSFNKPSLTKADSDMLNESKLDPQSGNGGDLSYKDHIDGA
ncbi:MAG: hypothetical protein Q4F15_03910 [Bacillota bacterium]|nr:hypothetical protein [Bacillota bacterium]